MNKGILYAISAFTLWGFFPFYFKALQAVPAVEILGHRMAWAALFIVAVLSYKRHWKWVRPALRSRKTLFTFLYTAVILTVNWLTYIWGVNAGFIVEASLGYFITPLVSVLLGFIFLGERLRLIQGLAIILAAAGVLYMTFGYGTLPWIALVLAFSFGTYGLLRKTAALSSLEGLSLETGLMFLPALIFLLYLEWQGAGSFGHTDIVTTFLLAFSGVATALPLLLFAAAARQITLTSLGLLQYIAPTLQFLIGVLVYNEPFDQVRIIGFSAIWLALFIYTLEGIVVRRRRARIRAHYV